MRLGGWSDMEVFMTHANMIYMTQVNINMSYDDCEWLIDFRGCYGILKNGIVIGVYEFILNRGIQFCTTIVFKSKQQPCILTSITWNEPLSIDSNNMIKMAGKSGEKQWKQIIKQKSDWFFDWFGPKRDTIVLTILK